MSGRASAMLALALLIAGACATTEAPDRARIATGITERSGVDARGLPVPGREWTPPPGTSLDDGLGLVAPARLHCPPERPPKDLLR